MELSRRVLLLLAAGKGDRLKEDRPKALVNIGEKPIVMLAAEKFKKIASLAVIAAPPGFEDEIGEKIAPIKMDFEVIRGGKTRQDSLIRCFEKAEELGKFDVVIEHDASRPFASEGLIKKVVRECERYGAAVPCVKIPDTVREVEGEWFAKTLDRDRLVIVQTPQCFKFELIKEAVKMAKKEKIVGTDGAELIIRLGIRVKIIEGERTNVKITYPEDLKRRCLF